MVIFTIWLYYLDIFIIRYPVGYWVPVSKKAGLSGGISGASVFRSRVGNKKPAQ
jgi:hypothetical protein